MYPVRNSAKALILRDGRLLCIRKTDHLGHYYILPGGGQEKYETFVQTLKRECLEELGCHVRVGSLKYIREYIAKNHEFAELEDMHQVEYMFLCELLDEPDLALATHLDTDQNGIEWVEVSATSPSRVYPKVLIGRLVSGCTEVYWGDIN